MNKEERIRVFYYFVEGVFEGASYFESENLKNENIVKIIKEEMDAIKQLEK